MMELQKTEQLCGSGVLTINLAACAHNYRALQAAACGAAAAAVLKADAYGLGAANIAPALWQAGCRLFFVAQPAEAFALREILAGAETGAADAQIAILNDALPQEAAAVAAAGFIPVLNSWDSVRQWAELGRAAGRPLPAMLQIDSGMSRLGLSRAELAQLCADPAPLTQIDLKALLSHLACADEPCNPMNVAQRARFIADAAQLEWQLGRRVPLSLSASGGAALGGVFRGDIIRPGIALYGMIERAAGQEPSRLAQALRPVIALNAYVLKTGQMQAGETCGYGATFRAAEAMPTATISVGYGDGWPRSLSNKGGVYYKGIRLPIIGRISMDCLVVSLAPLAAAGLAPPPRGGEVELIGEHQSLSQVAAEAGVIPYEILTSLGKRYQRRLIR